MFKFPKNRLKPSKKILVLAFQFFTLMKAVTIKEIQTDTTEMRINIDFIDKVSLAELNTFFDSFI